MRSVFCNLRSPHNKTLHCPLILWQLIESRRLLLYYDKSKENLCNHLQNLRSEEHTSELQSLMRISYAVFCLKKKKKINTNFTNVIHLQMNSNTYNNKL